MDSVQLNALPAEAYYEALVRDVERAQKRIIINAMIVHWGKRLNKLLAALEAALERSVDVQLVGDIYTKYEAKTSRIAGRGLDLTWTQSQTINQRLQAKGAHVVYFGKLGLNPFRGRCHTKITIVDDAFYTFGGVNFSVSHIGYADLMLRGQDRAMADYLATLVGKIEKGVVLPDLIEPFGPHTLLFDGGTPHKSVIYETALADVRAAQKVYFVSKMCPTGDLAKALNATDSTCYFNRPELEGPPENLAIMVDQHRYHIRNHYTGAGHIHAKFLLCERADGTRSLITGSNNFSWRGIAFGTKEIAVRSADAQLYQQLYDFLQTHIVGA